MVCTSADKSRSPYQNDQNGELAAYEEGKREQLVIIAERVTIDEETFMLRNQQRTLQFEINHLINQNQIYRLAMYFTGKESATEVTTPWACGATLVRSLSLIAAVCGVMLALAVSIQAGRGIRRRASLQRTL